MKAVLNANAVHKRARRVLPEVLATSGVLLEDESPRGLAALLFPLRRRSSGAVAFRLSAGVVDALGSDPMRMLQEALQARNGLGRHASPFTYRPWRKVRVPDTGEVVYFTASDNGRASIVVMPAERLAVYLWNDDAMPLDTPALSPKGTRLGQANKPTPGTSHSENPASAVPIPSAASTSLG
jgi:hypothetical protein